MRYFIYCRKSSEAEDRQVMSIESQLSTLRKAFASRPDIEIVGVFEEAFSAKSPGRPRFNDMIAQIQHGMADGIAAWAPDRLARNSIDGGQIIYLLDRGMIRDLKFATYTFENNSQGKFMLQIMFGQSKYYSDSLSDNVKRGNRTKVENGWRPNQAPTGYLNDPVTRTITKDPEHFPVIRAIFELMLTGSNSPRQIAKVARDQWGFRTPKKKRIGGKPLSLSGVYRILTNPFYAGLILWNGQIYAGKHEPVVTQEEFSRVRTLLKRPSPARPQHLTFAYTGLMRCGACGLRITAEEKVNRYSQRYTYYHCTRRSLVPRCEEPSIELRALERQIIEFLTALHIPTSIIEWALPKLRSQAGRAEHARQARIESVSKTAETTTAQLMELTGMRVRGLLTDNEFIAERKRLQDEQVRLQQQLSEMHRPVDRFEPAETVISFSNRATELFLHSSNQMKRQILEIISSNPTLRAKKLSIEAKNPFSVVAEIGTRLRLLGVVTDVSTFEPELEVWLHELLSSIDELVSTDKGRTMVEDMQALLDGKPLADDAPSYLTYKKPSYKSPNGVAVRALQRNGWKIPPSGTYFADIPDVPSSPRPNNHRSGGLGKERRTAPRMPREGKRTNLNAR